MPDTLERIDENAKDFTRTLMDLVTAIDGDIEQVVRLSVLKVFANIIRRSPVLFGGYRASHGITNSEPGTEEGIREGGENEAEAIRRSEAWIWKIEDGTIYIFNNMPYALRLEEGHSTQAPDGVYHLAIAEFNQIWEKELSKMDRLK